MQERAVLGNDGQASWCSTFMGPRTSGFTYGSYGWNQPTDEFFESYEEGDKRKDITVFMKDVRILMESPIRQVMLL